MKIWIVERWDDFSYAWSFSGAFSSEEKAIAYVDEHQVNPDDFRYYEDELV